MRGYYPDPTKIIMILHPDNSKAWKLFGAGHGFKFCMGSRYLGNYIRDYKSKRAWIKHQMDKWDRNICAATKTAGRYTQESYAVVDRAIQLEWILLQCVKKIRNKRLWE